VLASAPRTAAPSSTPATSRGIDDAGSSLCTLKHPTCYGESPNSACSQGKIIIYRQQRTDWCLSPNYEPPAAHVKDMTGQLSLAPSAGA
jgi:hypothetical protein